MVWEHDSACSNADSLCSGGDVRYDDRCRGACDSRHSMVLGEPVPVVAPGFRMLGEIARISKCVGCCLAFLDWGEVEDGKRNGQRYLRLMRWRARSLLQQEN